MINTWVQLKDGIAFASVVSPNFVEGAILLEDNLTWEDVKLKKYENGNWTEVEKIWFATKTGQFVNPLNSNETLTVLLSKDSTYFPSEVKGEIISAEVKEMWTKNSNNEWVLPPTIAMATQPDEINYPPSNDSNENNSEQ